MEAEAILGADIEKMAKLAEMSKKTPGNVIHEEESSGLGSSAKSSHRTDANDI